MATAAADQDEGPSARGTAIAVDEAVVDSVAEAVARGSPDLVGVGVTLVADPVEVEVELGSSVSSSGDMTRSITCIKPLFVLQSGQRTSIPASQKVDTHITFLLMILASFTKISPSLIVILMVSLENVV